MNEVYKEIKKVELFCVKYFNAEIKDSMLGNGNKKALIGEHTIIFLNYSYGSVYINCFYENEKKFDIETFRDFVKELSPELKEIVRIHKENKRLKSLLPESKQETKRTVRSKI